MIYLFSGTNCSRKDRTGCFVGVPGKRRPDHTTNLIILLCRILDVDSSCHGRYAVVMWFRR